MWTRSRPQRPGEPKPYEALTPSTDVDLFRIKIWDKNNGDAVVYDNMMDAADSATATTAIGGGSIVIHVPKGTK